MTAAAQLTGGGGGDHGAFVYNHMWMFDISTSQKTRLWGSDDDVTVHRQGPGKTGEGRPYDYSHQPERETLQLPAERLSVNYSTLPSEGLKIASTPGCQETASDRGYEEATSGFLAEIQRVDISRLADSNVQRLKHILAGQGRLQGCE
ncbi:hypothetical protein E2C01_010708 [Portunus trituberculatus]|uniref:Uncharacterized protein n=1 Tax=Portunus trituberculatus TaxID=210409 RepID=A0A5B7D961_PORTR|nr:hypothetical protein [Portunus trituberculatus]